jgi:hypothetical protein
LIDVFVGKVVPRRSLFDGSQLGRRQTRVLIERLALARRRHQLRVPALGEPDGHE